MVEAKSSSLSSPLSRPLSSPKQNSFNSVLGAATVTQGSSASPTASHSLFGSTPGLAGKSSRQIKAKEATLYSQPKIVSGPKALSNITSPKAAGSETVATDPDTSPLLLIPEPIPHGGLDGAHLSVDRSYFDDVAVSLFNPARVITQTSQRTLTTQEKAIESKRQQDSAMAAQKRI